MHPTIRELFTVSDSPWPVPVALGTWQFAPEHWNRMDTRQAKAVVRRALDRGIRHIDCAESYGNGRSEQIVGQVLRGDGTVTVATKSVARRMEPLARHLDRSLARLERSSADLYYLHWPRADVTADEAGAAFETLRDSGVVRHVGVCNIDPDDIDQRRLLERADVVQFGYNLVWRREETRLLPAARNMGVATIAYSPLQQGVLAHRFPDRPEWSSSDHRRNTPLFQEPYWAAVHDFHESYHSLCERHGQNAAAVALLWTIRSGVDAVVAGARAPDHVDTLLDGLVRATAYEAIDALLEEAGSLSDDLQPRLPPLPNIFGYAPAFRRR